MIIHFFFVIFVVSGFLFILAGFIFRLRAAANFRFRVLHLSAVSYVTVQSWLGRICPLTDLENIFRVKGGGTGYRKSFMEQWIEKIIYYDLPFSYFTTAYSLFLAVLLIMFFIYPPEKKSK